MPSAVSSSDAFLQVMQRDAGWKYTGYLMDCDRCGQLGHGMVMLPAWSSICITLCTSCERIVRHEWSVRSLDENWLAYDSALTAAAKAYKPVKGAAGAERSEGHP